MATLGDVPGLSDMLPGTADLLASDYSVVEVGTDGQVATPLGDVTQGLDANGDPFAPTVGFLDQPQGGTGGTGGAPAGSDPMASSYMPSYAPTSSYSGGAVGGYTDEQISNAQTIADVGKSVGASTKDIQTALMAAIVESGLKNIAYGDRDSVGLFQQRDAWGSFEDRTTPAKAAEMFFLGGSGGQRGLLDIDDRKGMSMGEAAQAVQVSAYPDRYAEHEAEAAELLGTVSGGARTTGSYEGKNPYDLTEYDGKTVDNMTAAALDAATEAFGSGFHVMQGSHSDSVAASGGTHSGGGVVDIAPENGDWEGAIAALRKIGFAAWGRNMPGYGSAGSGAHIHAVLIGDSTLSPEAATQVNSYLHDDDGLSGSRPDDGPRDFVNNRFVWGDATKPDPLGHQRKQIVNQAKTFLGTPFKWGGEDYSGVDTMGFLRGTYRQLGVELPKTTVDLMTKAEPVPLNETKPGDLVSWGTDAFGIYLGNGRIISADSPGRVVQLNDLGSDALNAWGIPMDRLLNRSTTPAAPDPSVPAPSQMTRPADVQTIETRPGTSVVEPHAHITATPKPAPSVLVLGANKPHER